jgi:hypothetical protein
VNLVVRAQARPYMTTLEGLNRPWNLLEGYLAPFARESVLFGTGYIGWGTFGGSGLQAAIPRRAAAGAPTTRHG